MIHIEEFRELNCVIRNEFLAREFTDFSYDSRLTNRGELFVALKTQRDDGCNYILDAIEAGATGVICQKNFSGINIDKMVVIETEDPLGLIKQWATNRLKKVNPLTIAVTGSLGKTSTKHTISKLLSNLGPTFESRQSFNSTLGLSISMAGLESRHKFAVLEFGSNSFGEIEKLASYFSPKIAVLTNVDRVHFKIFGSFEKIAIETGALIQSLPTDGFAFVNGDNEYINREKERSFHHLPTGRMISFGRGKNNDLYIENLQLTPERTKMRVIWRGGNEYIAEKSGAVDISVPIFGMPSVYIILASVGVALACGMSLAEIAGGLSDLDPVNGRLRLFSLPENVLLVDDTYSASIPSTLAALDTIREIPARKRIVILGGVDDIGEDAESCKKLGGHIGEISDCLICKGDSAVSIVKAARESDPNIDAVVAYTSATVLRKARELIGPGDLILVKGDRISRMEGIVHELLPPRLREQAGELLARQETRHGKVRIRSQGRPTWVNINLDNYAQNIRLLREIAKVPVLAVVKADAYGHGAVRLSHTALSAGAEALAVATLSEAKQLRDAGVNAPILILGYTPGWQAHEAVLLNITCTVFDLDVAHALSTAGTELRRNVRVHVKVDTGMNRLGLQPHEVVPFLKKIHPLPNLSVEGMYTHFAAADISDQTYTRLQFERFQKLLQEIDAEKINGETLRPPIIHAANSAAIFNFPEARFDMVRPGIACYGLAPSNETPLPVGFSPVLSFHTQIAQVKVVPAGTPLSYGGTYITQKEPSIIATIPVGYADGMKRCPPWREVLVHGRRVKVVGRICMDYALIDVSEIKDVKCGDRVTLIGKQEGDEISATEVANWLNTINYEIVSTILPRVPRDVSENVDLS